MFSNCYNKGWQRNGEQSTGIENGSNAVRSNSYLVVCVDDETFMLNAVKRLVRRLRPNWQVLRESNAIQWQTKLQQRQPDIVISDLLMPGKDGESLLQDVRQQFPTCIRVLLTGDTKGNVKQTAFNYAHFVIPKPFESIDFEHLFDCVERLRELPFSHDCKVKLGQLTALPVLPSSVKALRKTLQSEDCTANDIAQAVSIEPVLVAKIFQVANSSFLGFRQQTSVLSEAIKRIGVSLLESLAISLLCEFSNEKQLLMHQQTAQHALKAASKVKYLALCLKLPIEQQDNLATATLLSGIGQILKQTQAHQHCQSDQPLHRQYSDEDVITAYILSMWGFDSAITDLILAQSSQQGSEPRSFEPAHLIGISKALLSINNQQELSRLELNVAEQWPAALSSILVDIVNKQLNQ